MTTRSAVNRLVGPSVGRVAEALNLDTRRASWLVLAAMAGFGIITVVGVRYNLLVQLVAVLLVCLVGMVGFRWQRSWR